MRRPVPRVQGVFGSRPPNVDDDGSGGLFVRGIAVGFLPEGHSPDLKPRDPLNWHAQGGAPHGVSSTDGGPRSGGTYESPVDRGGAPLKPAVRVPDHKPFRVR